MVDFIFLLGESTPVHPVNDAALNWVKVIAASALGLVCLVVALILCVAVIAGLLRRRRMEAD